MTYWAQALINTMTGLGPGGVIVVFPAYRPDLVEDLALALGCAHVDFRREKLAPLGMSAHTLDLGAIEACAAERANAQGVVLQNAEALLAAKSAAMRRAWLGAFVEKPRDRLTLLPLAIFGDDAPDHPRVLRIDRADVPVESLLMQLASMRIQ